MRSKTRAPRVLLTTGGTGGHIYPAVALADELSEKHACPVFFAGGGLSKNPYFEKEKYSFQDVRCGQFKMAPWAIFKESCALLKGVRDAMAIIREFAPDLVVGFGSYYTVPVLLASKLLKKPVFLHEANSIPGRVNRWLAPYAEMTWVHFPGAQALLKGQSAMGGMPLRNAYRQGIISKNEARRHFRLSPDHVTLLIFGGSQGAKRINQLVSTALLSHPPRISTPIQVLHFTGDPEEAKAVKGGYDRVGIVSYVAPFEKRMEWAWAAADFCITRAGAASIAEQMEFEVPGILIPFPRAMDQHQDKNADFISEIGLGVKRVEAGLTPAQLTVEIERMISEREYRRDRCRQFKLSHPFSSVSDQIIQWFQGK